MSLNLINIVVEFLKSNPEHKFTARDIATSIYQQHPEQYKAKIERSSTLKTDTDLIQQLVREIGSQRVRLQKKHPQVKTTDGYNRKYYFTAQSEAEEIEVAEGISQKNASSQPLKEHDLYPLLSEYLWTELSLYSKRIDEKRSSNKQGPNGNKWLYPDLVAMEDLTAEWDQEIRDCVSQYADKKTRLWSFEVIIILNRSNVRQAFFQTVSNSSWANFGYLVTTEIQGSHTLKELRMLFSAHGIGLIQLDEENPSESQILIPAKEKTQIDWDSANRLAIENKDFRTFTRLIRQFYQTGDPRMKDWDVV